MQQRRGEEETQQGEEGQRVRRRAIIGGGIVGLRSRAPAPPPPHTRAAPPPKKVAKPVVPKVYYTVADRGNKKHVTKVVGLEAYLPPTTKLKEAASALGKRFGAGATVSKATNNPAILEIDIQVRGPCRAWLLLCSHSTHPVFPPG